MNKKILFGFLVLLVLASGCIKAGVSQMVDREGVLQTNTFVDFSAFVSSNPLGIDLNQAGLSDPCVQQRAAVVGKFGLISFSCRQTGSFAFETVMVEQLEPPVFSKKEDFFSTKYSFDIGKYQARFRQSQPLPQGASSYRDLNEEQARQLEEFGVQLNYFVVMPGNISNTTIGRIEGNRVVVSLADFAELSDQNVDHVVFSEETNPVVLYLLLFAIVFFLLLGAVAVFLFFKRKGVVGPKQQPAVPEQLVQQKMPLAKPVVVERKQMQEIYVPLVETRQSVMSRSVQNPVLNSGQQLPEGPAVSEKDAVEKEPAGLETKRVPEKNAVSSGGSAEREAGALGPPVVETQKSVLEQELDIVKSKKQVPESGLSAEDLADVKSIVGVLMPQKDQYSKEQLVEVLLDKGYSDQVIKEVVKRLLG